MLLDIAPPCSLQSQSNFTGFREGWGFERALTLCGLLNNSESHNREHFEEIFSIPQFSVDYNISRHAFINSFMVFQSSFSYLLLPFLTSFYIPFQSSTPHFSLIYFFQHRLCCPFCFKHLLVWLFPPFCLSVPPTLKCFSSVCLASNPPNPSWASFMKMQIHSRAGKNVNRRKLPCSTNQKRHTIKKQAAATRRP